MDKNIIFKLEPEEGFTGIPINSLYKILSSFQKALWMIGEYSVNKALRSNKGRPSQNVSNLYTLEIIACNKGSLEIIAQLPNIPQQMQLFNIDINKPEKDLQDLSNLIKNIKDKDFVCKVLPDTSLKAKVLRTIKEISPENGIKYIKINDAEIQSDFEESIKELFIPTILGEEENQIFGPIVEIKIVKPAYFGILSKGKIEKFPLPEELIEAAIPCIAKIVQLDYISSSDIETGKKTINEIIDIKPLDKDKFSIEEIKYDEIRFSLSQPLEIKLTLAENIWTLDNGYLGIISYGDSFDIAWESFQEDFYYLWNEIGKEDDRELEKDAIELKKKINSIIVNVSKYAEKNTSDINQSEK